MAKVRDKLWMFGVKAHQDDIWLKPDTHGQNPTYWFRSRITPAEGAFMMDIPNVLFISCDGEPAPFSKDALGYMESFCRMDRVLWGCSGSSGFRAGNEEQFVLSLAEKYDNLTGVFLDDISLPVRASENKEEAMAKVVSMLADVKNTLSAANKPLDTYITWYWHEEPYPGMMEYVDGFSFWTWNSEDLPKLPERFARIENTYRDKKVLLGIYMYDFYNRRPVSAELMEFQCNYALSLLKEGRIDGIIIEANSVMGINLPTEKWLRRWIEEVKNVEVPD